MIIICCCLFAVIPFLQFDQKWYTKKTVLYNIINTFYEDKTTRGHKGKKFKNFQDHYHMIIFISDDEFDTIFSKSG